MPSFLDQIGIQSYCFRHFKDNARVAQMIKECGLARIELCGVHVNFDDQNSVAQAIKTYKGAGVAIPSIGVEGMRNNEASERRRFEFCKAAGAKVVGCDFGLDTTPACYRTAEKLAEEFDMVLAIHNHGGRHWLGCVAMLEHVLKNTSPRVGLCLDTAWALDSHEDPVAMAEKFLPRLYGVHIKDFVFTRAGKPEDVVVGTGNLNLPKFMQVLKSAPKLGSVVLEYEGDVENPVPALTKCVQELKKLC